MNVDFKFGSLLSEYKFSKEEAQFFKECHLKVKNISESFIDKTAHFTSTSGTTYLNECRYKDNRKDIITTL
jgi:hypothetical protein